MKQKRRIPDVVWRWMRPFNRRFASIYSSGFRASHLTLLLTTRGRKTGLPRRTPLQFEEIDGCFYVGSARGEDADWFRNIIADPRVEVQVQDECTLGIAEPVTDPKRIADFFELRLERHPKMIGMIMRAEGLPKNYDRADLERFAEGKAMVIIHPIQQPDLHAPDPNDHQDNT